jgi:hypothetical protein
MENAMLNLLARKGVRFCDGLTRRDFLRVGSLSAGAAGLSLADVAGLRAAGASGDVNCILLFLVGGPSHLDTWDLKPHAPDTVRGPFRPISTNVPGIQIGEHFPRMASMADRYAIVRSVHHRAAPIHETGHQLMQTGRLFQSGQEYPHYGAVLSHVRGPRRNAAPPFVLLPAPIGNTGVSVSHGQTAGALGATHEPTLVRAKLNGNGFEIGEISLASGIDPARPRGRHEMLTAIDQAQRAIDATQTGGAARSAFDTIFAQQSRQAFDLARESDALRSRYGGNTFGQSCLLARRLVENGVRLVTVNMFDSVFNQTTWDCHADSGSLASTLDDYRRTLCPMFDSAYTALLEDLRERGMLATTMVVAMGEFGRTPQLNPQGGRDHWPGAWSILFAGGKIRGGQVVGATDRIGSEPRERPISPSEIAASIYHGLGLDWQTAVPGPDNRPLPLADAQPVRELFHG